MKYSMKLYVEAYQNKKDTPLHLFKEISNEQTYRDPKGRIQFFFNEREHIGIPVGYWLVIFPNEQSNEQRYKVYNNENFEALFHKEEQYTNKELHQTPSGANPVYLDRPYPNNVHSIKTILGLSNKKLGALCGLGYTTIANMDRGDRPVTDEYKELIEKGTGYEVIRYYE